MSGWWSTFSASGARRLTNAIASMKSLNVYFLEISSPWSVQPFFSVSSRWSTSARVSLAMSLVPLRPLLPFVSLFLLGFLCSYLIEAHSRRFHGVQRFLLHLDRARPFRWARKRAAGDGPMIRALGALKIRE